MWNPLFKGSHVKMDALILSRTQNQIICLPCLPTLLILVIIVTWTESDKKSRILQVSMKHEVMKNLSMGLPILVTTVKNCPYTDQNLACSG